MKRKKSASKSRVSPVSLLPTRRDVSASTAAAKNKCHLPREAAEVSGVVQGWQGMAGPRLSRRWRGMGRCGWGCARRRRSAHSRKLGHAPNPGRGRLGLGVLSVQMGIKYVLSLGQRPLLQCQFSYCPCTFSASAVKFSQLSILSVQVWAMNGVLRLSASAALALCVLWVRATRVGTVRLS